MSTTKQSKKERRIQDEWRWRGLEVDGTKNGRRVGEGKDRSGQVDCGKESPGGAADEQGRELWL